MNTEQNHVLNEVDINIHQCLWCQHLTSTIVRYTAIQIALFHPMSCVLHYIPNLQMEYCQEALFWESNWLYVYRKKAQMSAFLR